MKEKQINQLWKRCDSCGDRKSHRKYNHAYLCYYCLHMDRSGFARDDKGKILDSTTERK